MSDAKKFVAIGDIHGCAKSLEELIEKMKSDFGSEPCYVFLGDYIDRGPDSKSVIDLLIDFDKQYETVFLRGNHDQMLLDALNEDEWTLWMRNGGQTTIDSYGATMNEFSLPDDHYQFYANTKLWYDTEQYFFVHGGLNPNKTIQQNLSDESEIQRFMWQRDHVYTDKTEWEKTVVFGHTPVKSPILQGKKLGLDTGCVYKNNGLGTLSAVLLPELRFIAQSCTDII